MPPPGSSWQPRAPGSPIGGRRLGRSGRAAYAFAGFILGGACGAVVGHLVLPAGEAAFWHAAYRNVDAAFWQLQAAYDGQARICDDIAANAKALIQLCGGAGDQPPRSLFSPPAIAPTGSFGG